MSTNRKHRQRMATQGFDLETDPPAWIVPAALVISILVLGALTVGAVVEGGL